MSDNPNLLHITECPRDAMQGILTFIPTKEKVAYLNQLLKVGFDTLDFGSFVSAKAIPQLSDTAQVLDSLDPGQSPTKLLAIVANERGGNEACAFEQIAYLGFPLSLSETFQQRNTNKSISDAYPLVAQLQRLCQQHHKELIVYLSMGFGNPYGDSYEENDIIKAIDKLREIGITHVLPSDTVGLATSASIGQLFTLLFHQFPEINFGAHLHSQPLQAAEKLQAAYSSGCRRFDTSLKGIGGCPMASDQLTGNIATESLVRLAEQHQWGVQLNREEMFVAMEMADHLFAKYH